MTNGKEPSYPTVVRYDGDIMQEHQVSDGGLFQQYGLTKREYFSIKVLQGMLADTNVIANTTTVKLAIVVADLLISELNK